MFLWFLACGVIVVMFVFRSSGIDYRVVIVGSVSPLIENLTGSPWILHTLAGSVVLLLIVMLTTVGRHQRLKRRRWLGLPIGTFVFLISSGAWQRTNLFWWPFAGFSTIGSGMPPELDRPLLLLVCLEILGGAGLAVLIHHHRLYDTERLSRFLKTGRI